ncbi:MAG: glycerophosphodiester phosphodiesterase [Parasphingopyxis sp.]|nr:glycerophosphodiester phosphodiesterase [Sphingomonadales bacterium]
MLAACATTPPAPSDDPLIIAHRGASSERPEHTLEAYARAIEQGADYIEPDLVMTRDGVFVARHENEISGTTDIADHPEFADRRTTRTIDGSEVTGWFTEDFTLAELKTLRARERLPQLRPGNAEYDRQFEVPSLAEILDLVQSAGRPVGLAPEIKHPGYFRSIGLPMEEALAGQLAAAGYETASDPVIIQSFEIAPLVRLDQLTDLRLLQLIGNEGGPADAPGMRYPHMLTPEGLRAIGRYADAIGPDKAYLIRWTPEGELGDPTGLVAAAHETGLAVIPYTFRPENYFLPQSMRSGADPRARGDSPAEIARYLTLGIDGLFTDHVPAALEARSAFAR